MWDGRSLGWSWSDACVRMEQFLAECLHRVMKNMCHQLILKTGDISKLITPWKGSTTEKNATSFVSAVRLLRKGVQHDFLSAEVMSEVAKKGDTECITSGGGTSETQPVDR